MKKTYHYDLHCHTNNSPDSPTKIEEIIKIAKERGLDGLAITDHDRTYQGPPSIDGIEIIPANEISLKGGGHLLAYFVEKDFPKKLDLKQAISEIKKQKGYAVLAHPFRREHGHFKSKPQQEIKKALKILDGVEVGNASDSDESRSLALDLKKEYPGISFFPTAGSDAHMAGQIGFGIVETKEKLNQDNFSQILLEAETVVRPESNDFRKKSFFWKNLLFRFKVAKILGSTRIKKFKKIFYIFVLRNYFRLNNKKFSKIKFNFKNE